MGLINQVVGYSVWLFGLAGLYFALLAGWTIWKKRRPKHAQRWMKFIAKLKGFRDKTDGWAFVPYLFSALVMGFLLLGATKITFAPIVEKYDVKVLKRISYNEWAMEDASGPFVYRGCDDFPNETVIWAGYIAKKMRWQEFGDCKSIRREDLGVWWLRDSNYSVRRIE